MNSDLTRRGFLAGTAASIALHGLPDLANAQSTSVPARPEQPTLLTNLKLFEGKSALLQDGKRVLVEGQKIKAIEDRRH